jgi:hypothetical protein
MKKYTVPFLDLPLGQRIRRIARNGLAGSLIGIPLYLAAAFGGRFQDSRGSVVDAWLLAALYPLGLFLSFIIGALFGRWWKSRWTASIAAGVSTIPLFGLLSVAFSHSGPTAPYRILWPLTLWCCGLSASVTPLCYNYWRRRMDEIQQRIQRDGTTA